MFKLGTNVQTQPACTPNWLPTECLVSVLTHGDIDADYGYQSVVIDNINQIVVLETNLARFIFDIFALGNTQII